MENDLKNQIQEIIDRAREARSEHLNKENPEALGYPYVAGFMTASLTNIERLLTSAE